MNQRKGENDRRKYFMIKSPQKNVADTTGVEPTTIWSRIQQSHQGRLYPVCIIITIISAHLTLGVEL